MKARFLTLLGTVLLSATARAASPASPIDTRVRLLYRHHAATGATLPLFRRSVLFEASGMAPLVVQWRRPPDAAELAHYQGLGCELGPRLATGAVLLRARAPALAAMKADGVLARVGVDLPPPALVQPLDLAAVETGVDQGVAAHRLLTAEELDGSGVLVGDFDSRIDLYHPAFFRALAPTAWLDVDGDGALTVGTDGVDLDQSGTIEPGEVLRLLDGNARDLTGQQDHRYGTDDPGFNPAWDYLYLDTNGDGRRNVGSEVPGAEQLPSLGEPLYAGDDVDGDGVVRAPEKVRPLGDTKVRAIRYGATVYRRGDNLASFEPTSAFDLAEHGTMMASISVGGQPHVSRFLGLAPNAELVVAVTSDLGQSDSFIAPVQWLADEGADVILTELGYYGTVPSDGSSELELLLDALVEQGTVVVSPAGNLGYASKHAWATIPGAGAPEPYQNGIVIEDDATTIFLSITWREGEREIGGTLDLGDGDVIDLGVEEANGKTAKNRAYVVAPGTTPKGAGYEIVAVSAFTALPESGITLSLRTTAAESATAELFIADEVSGWYGGANFTQADLDGCMNPPARAANTLAIGAYALHAGPEYAPYAEKPGQLRAFSGRGPDLWGDPGIDLVAADNPVAAFPDVYADGAMAEGMEVHWSEAGGTSGAGAVAAAVVALDRQESSLDGMALRSHVLAAAESDADVEAGTAAQWGAGKLRLGGGSAPGAPPTIVALASELPGPVLTVTVDDDGDPAALRSRWDLGYDGSWETDWLPGTSMPYAPPAGFPVLVAVEVMDDAGWTDRAVGSVDEPPPLPPAPAAAADTEEGCGCRLPAGDSSAGHWALGLLGAALLGRCSRRRTRPREARSTCSHSARSRRGRRRHGIGRTPRAQEQTPCR